MAGGTQTAKAATRGMQREPTRTLSTSRGQSNSGVVGVTAQSKLEPASSLAVVRDVFARLFSDVGAL